MKLNAWQKAIAKTYALGDYAYFAEQEEIDPDDLDNCGDTLFRFLMVELANKEDCDSLEEAIRRCEAARRELDNAISVLEAL